MGLAWELLERIFEGNTTPPPGRKKPAKVPAGASAFVNIGPIPDRADALIVLLSAVVAGTDPERLQDHVQGGYGARRDAHR